MAAKVERERVLMESREQWRGWLAAHHAESPGIWLVRWKKGQGPHLTYDDLVEEALCFGWVDSQAKGLDERQSMLLLTPRKPRSNWSAANKERIAKLEAAGLIEPAGAAMVQLARETGTWDALNDVEGLVEPPELAAALDAAPVARREWDAFPRSARRGILEWLGTAKTAVTREKRIVEIVSQAASGQRANSWPRQ